MFAINYIICFVFFCLFSFINTQNSERPLLRVSQGLLSGAWKISGEGTPYASFEGVPYARPPVGKYRFREPRRPKPWAGVWDASMIGSPCLQYNPFSVNPDNKIEGSEDCLFLNVYTPRVHAAAAFPVVVFIHGGAFMYGAGSLYGAKHIVDKNIILVTLNYRLGPLGFLATNDEAAAGNMGLKDQALALHWVKENIIMFGGNPDSITIMGLSAGGASVHYHYLSPFSRGTFARGIALSGSAFSSWVLTTNPREKAKALSSHLGCPVTTTKEMVECIRYRPAESVVRAQTIFYAWNVNLFSPFTPVVESAFSREPFINQHPYAMARGGQAQPLPLMTSVTSEEGLYPAASFLAEEGLLDNLESNWEVLAPYLFEYNTSLPEARHAEVARKIKLHYMKGKAVTRETFPQLVQALGDRLFVVDVGKAAQVHAAQSGRPVYVYRFTFRGNGSLSNTMAGDDNNYGVSHGDDLYHVLNTTIMDISKSAEDTAMSKELLDIIHSFASNGKPSINGVVWTPLDSHSKDIKYLEISGPNSYEMKSSADLGNKVFWNSLGFFENENFKSQQFRDEL